MSRSLAPIFSKSHSSFLETNFFLATRHLSVVCSKSSGLKAFSRVKNIVQRFIGANVDINANCKKSFLIVIPEICWSGYGGRKSYLNYTHKYFGWLDYASVSSSVS